MTVYNIDTGTNQLSKAVLDAAFYIHTQMGPGLLESVYEKCMFHYLSRQGYKVEGQKVLPVFFDGFLIESGFRLDLLIEDKLIVEIKACEKILPIHEAQIHTYLKLSEKTLGLILNFNVRSMKDGIKRIAKTNMAKENFV